MRDKLMEMDPARVVFTESILSAPETWEEEHGKPFMPMRDYSKDFLGNDSLGIVMKQNPLRIWIGIMYLPKMFREEKTIEFESIDDLINAGWLVD